MNWLQKFRNGVRNLLDTICRRKLEDIYQYYKEKAGVRTAKKIILDIISRTIGLEKIQRLAKKKSF